jgi:hypothetical protein
VAQHVSEEAHVLRASAPDDHAQSLLGFGRAAGSDSFLLLVAEVSATLIGLFLVGLFFFVETGFRRLAAGEALEPYFRASTRIVLLLYALPLFLSLTLVALDLGWSQALFVALSLLLVAANVETIRCMLPVARAIRSPALLANEAAGTVLVALIVVVPWALGGLDPTREDLTWAILLSFAAGFLSIGALMVSVFDIPRDEPAD